MLNGRQSCLHWNIKFCDMKVPNEHFRETFGTINRQAITYAEDVNYRYLPVILNLNRERDGPVIMSRSVNPM
ncbi:UNVERIFIED_CONTAM: hypothetical protein GTU68_064944 [Idotea baltica]|nr:hypothetical protein [Idotea baltica]